MRNAKCSALRVSWKTSALDAL